MTWFGWLMVAWVTIGTLFTVGTIGEPRFPLTNDVAVIVCIINGLIVAAILMVGTGSL